MPGKSVIEKLLVKKNNKFVVLNAPPDYWDSLRGLPEGVKLGTNLSPTADIIQCFVKSKAELETLLPQLKSAFHPKGILWVCYPKGTSGMVTDINRDIIRLYAPTHHLEAVSLFSIDETWSAMRLKMV